ncbi:MAG: MarR family transcriptional regulator [Anaerolineae bacterium]|nr:MarR family transcriptional regulator [Anaerolineae bacterium]
MPTKYQGTREEQRALNAYIKLQRAAETSLNRTTAHLAQHGLSTSQFAILEALYHLGTLSQSELAQKMLKSTGNISSILKHMEKDGLVSRVRDPDDNRYMQVCITNQGRAVIDKVLASHIAGIVAEMSVLSADEQDELARLCRKLGLRVPEPTPSAI